MRTLLLLISAAALAAGCKDKTAKPAAATGSATGSAAGSAAPAGSPLTLPKFPATPPVKTTAPLTKEQFDKLAALRYPGFRHEIRQDDARVLEVRYRTEERPRLWITITASHCFDCVPMQLDAWKAKTESLKTMLPPVLRDLSSTTFEVGATELPGATAIHTYQLAMGTGHDPATDSPTSGMSHAYVLYYNDGTNMIRVVSEYKDDPPATREQLVALAPREDLEKIAVAFLGAFTHAW
ncbi:MAG: hypothetical protein ACTHU0_31130 [Kofleriaceae bacterium]